MSVATQCGFVIGAEYVLARTDDEYSNWVKGTRVTFDRDDDTDIPRFRNMDGESRYVPLHCFGPQSRVSAKVTFEDEEVVTFKTIINAGRQLTQAEKDAIQSIIDQGA